jgi:hypothetical protein
MTEESALDLSGRYGESGLVTRGQSVTNSNISTQTSCDDDERSAVIRPPNRSTSTEGIVGYQLP